VRELEGAVIKLLAYSSLTRREVTTELARDALGGVLLDGPGQEVDVGTESGRRSRKSGVYRSMGSPPSAGPRSSRFLARWPCT